MIPKSRLTIRKIMPELVKILDQYNWDVDDAKFAMILSMVLYPADNVRFTPKESEHSIEIYVSGIVQTFLNNSISQQKDQIINNLLDEKKNPLYVALGVILDKAFEWRKYLEKLNIQRPMLFDTDHTIQFQLDMNIDDYIEMAVNETLEYDYTDIYDIYGVFLPKMEKTVRSEVGDVIEGSDFDQAPEPEKKNNEKPESENFDYIQWKTDRKKSREQEDKLKVHDDLNPGEDIVPENPDQESKVETPPNKAKKRKLKKKK
jgi:hypothetical protein